MSLGECPISITGTECIQLAHGGGGRMMNDLLNRLLPLLPGVPTSMERHDAAVFSVSNGRLAFTTDSYVVSPLFFPGGDIGILAVNGTINDLAMCGAMPAFMSCSLIIEEGLPIFELERIVNSMATACRNAGIKIITGDTKVVDHGKGDGVFINTAGIGIVEHNLVIAPAAICPGDAIILSGDLGRHSVAVMGAREGLGFGHDIQSDTASLHEPIRSLLEAKVSIHCLRDLTRGGLASALVELAEARGLGIKLQESSLPVCAGVRGACEILGLDPMYLANEGRFVCFVAENEVDKALSVLKKHPETASATLVGHVSFEPRGYVTLIGRFGTERIVTMLCGEQLPRIC